MKVVALTSGTNVPSARFRITQHLSSLMGKGIDVLEIPAKHNSTPPKEKRLIWFILALVDNIIRTIKSRQYDLVIVQKPMISTLYSSEAFIRGKYIFDVDDSVHLNSRLSSVDYIAKNSFSYYWW
ncbi:hypothetical protein [Photobacterium leiognathi]|uniref:hypothetical protein n=1 Tax=Photobacterium leiognathi TaxID=553611 RepID=UPI0027347540|nr:hypothetical protein [Photobacterium leiognathi]